jgi:adenylate cyclase
VGAALVGLLLAAGLEVVLHFFTKLGSGLENASYDLLFIARGDRPVEGAAIVYLDERSYEELHQPLNAPWDRALHARLIDRLAAAGAKAIVFDIVFSDPNTNNPAADEQLAQAIKRAGRVVLAIDVFPTGAMKQGKPPFPLLMDSAAAAGSAEVLADPDLIVRRLHSVDADIGIPSLARAAAEVAGAKGLQEDNKGLAQPWMNYYGPPNHVPWKSYAEALNPERAEDGFFRGRVVFVGARLLTKFANERKDEYASPYSRWLTEEMVKSRGARFMSGVEIQATACLNLIRGDWLVRLSAARETQVIFGLGALLGFGLVWLRPVWAGAVALFSLVLIAVASYFLFTRELLWFPWLIVSVQIGIALAWSILFNSIQLYVQKRLYEYTLGLYLPPPLVSKFAGDPSLLKPGAVKQILTILFTDIANFTPISQCMDSDALAEFMNRYFQTAISQGIHKTDGTVGKYIGDAIFAFWNAPDPQPDHALRACTAALLIRDHGIRDIHGQPLSTRIGIHTGEANVGNFGSLERVDYTALGESVNLASRLEGLNKYLSTECVISATTKEASGEQLVTRRLGQFQLKGFEKPVGVYELVGWPDEAEATRPWREAFAEALNNYEQRNLEFAEAGFRQVLRLRPEDGPSKFYLVRLDELRTQVLPEDWATHTVLKEK